MSNVIDENTFIKKIKNRKSHIFEVKICFIKKYNFLLLSYEYDY